MPVSYAANEGVLISSCLRAKRHMCLQIEIHGQRKTYTCCIFFLNLVKSILGRVVVGILPTTFPLQELWPILKAVLKSMLM